MRTLWPALLLAGAAAAAEKERTEHFDADPNWEGVNNRAATPEKRTVRQDFGYSQTAHAGGKPGEIGGFITPAAEPAYYAQEARQEDVRRPAHPLPADCCARAGSSTS